MSFEHAVNERIRAKEVRLVGVEGEPLGIWLTKNAIHQARQQGLDLVEIASNAVPPVCRILDYGKFKFDLSKAEKERAKKMREAQVDTKEIQLRPVTDDHDVAIKAKRAREFLADGDRVKIVLKFRGRELAHKDIGRKVMDGFLDAVGAHKVEKPVTMSEKNMFTIIGPIKAATVGVSSQAAPLAPAVVPAAPAKPEVADDASED